jgi:hypothetical protein
VGGLGGGVVAQASGSLLGGVGGAGGGPESAAGPRKPTQEALQRASLAYKEELAKAQTRLCTFFIFSCFRCLLRA